VLLFLIVPLDIIITHNVHFAGEEVVEWMRGGQKNRENVYFADLVTREWEKVRERLYYYDAAHLRYINSHYTPEWCWCYCHRHTTAAVAFFAKNTKIYIIIWKSSSMSCRFCVL